MLNPTGAIGRRILAHRNRVAVTLRPCIMCGSTLCREA